MGHTINLPVGRSDNFRNPIYLIGWVFCSREYDWKCSRSLQSIHCLQRTAISRFQGTICIITSSTWELHLTSPKYHQNCCIRLSKASHIWVIYLRCYRSASRSDRLLRGFLESLALSFYHCIGFWLVVFVRWVVGVEGNERLPNQMENT